MWKACRTVECGDKLWWSCTRIEREGVRSIASSLRCPKYSSLGGEGGSDKGRGLGITVASAAVTRLRSSPLENLRVGSMLRQTMLCTARVSAGAPRSFIINAITPRYINEQETRRRHRRNDMQNQRRETIKSVVSLDLELFRFANTIGARGCQLTQLPGPFSSLDCEYRFGLWQTRAVDNLADSRRSTTLTQVESGG